MSTAPDSSTGEYEFTDAQNQLIADLAKKMALVGFVMTFFGFLQIFNGVTSLIMSRNPDRVVAAAQKAGMPEAQLDTLREAMAGPIWSSPIAISSLAFAVAGLILLMIGIWTRQAAFGFAGIVATKGKDISRLMDAIRALHTKYGLIYSILLAAAIISLASLLLSLWQHWRG